MDEFCKNGCAIVLNVDRNLNLSCCQRLGNHSECLSSKWSKHTHTHANIYKLKQTEVWKKEKGWTKEWEGRIYVCWVLTVWVQGRQKIILAPKAAHTHKWVLPGLIYLCSWDIPVGGAHIVAFSLINEASCALIRFCILWHDKRTLPKCTKVLL